MQIPNTPSITINVFYLDVLLITAKNCYQKCSHHLLWFFLSYSSVREIPGDMEGDGADCCKLQSGTVQCVSTCESVCALFGKNSKILTWISRQRWKSWTRRWCSCSQTLWMCRGSPGEVERPWIHCKSQSSFTVEHKNMIMNSDLAFFPSLFLSEGKAMELFRKLREKPRGLAVTRAFHSLHNTVLSCGTEVARPPGVHFPFLLLRPEVSRGQPRGGAPGGPSSAVLREETERFLHTP